MPRAIVALVIVGIGGLIGYLYFFRNCSGGVVLRDPGHCREAGFGDAFCKDFPKRLEALAAASATVFPSEADCRDRQASCVARENPRGWSPVPAALCVVRNGASIVRIEPVYEPAGARRAD